MPAGVDRYPVDPTNQDKVAAERLQAIEARLRQLESRQVVGNTTVRNGALIFTDGAGNPLVRIGRREDGTYGLEVFDVLGNVVVAVGSLGLAIQDSAGLDRVFMGLVGVGDYGINVRDDDNGLHLGIHDDGYLTPYLSTPWRRTVNPDRESTASGSFVDLWTGRVPLITHLGVGCAVAWVTDVGTTGEIRVRRGASNTSSVALAAASNGIQLFRWLHGATLLTGDVDFHIQGRVTGGGGSLHLDQPYGGLNMISPLVCDADGVP